MTDNKTGSVQYKIITFYVLVCLNLACVRVCMCMHTPDHPKGRNLPSSQFSPLTKNSPAIIMNTHTMRLMTFSTLLKPTEFFTPKATITVTSSAMSSASRSGYDCSPLPREETHRYNYTDTVE